MKINEKYLLELLKEAGYEPSFENLDTLLENVFIEDEEDEIDIAELVESCSDYELMQLLEELEYEPSFENVCVLRESPEVLNDFLGMGWKAAGKRLANAQDKVYRNARKHDELTKQIDSGALSDKEQKNTIKKRDKLVKKQQDAYKKLNDRISKFEGRSTKHQAIMMDELKKKANDTNQRAENIANARGMLKSIADSKSKIRDKSTFKEYKPEEKTDTSPTTFPDPEK